MQQGIPPCEKITGTGQDDARYERDLADRDRSEAARRGRETLAQGNTFEALRQVAGPDAALRYAEGLAQPGHEPDAGPDADLDDEPGYDLSEHLDDDPEYDVAEYDLDEDGDLDEDTDYKPVPRVDRLRVPHVIALDLTDLVRNADSTPGDWRLRVSRIEDDLARFEAVDADGAVQGVFWAKTSIASEYVNGGFDVSSARARAALTALTGARINEALDRYRPR